jgi:uncharacterized protein
MKNPRLRPPGIFAAVLAAGLLAGCSLLSPKPDYSQFFVLSALPASAAPATPPAPDVAMGVFIPDIPAYLDRPQIVARTGENQVSLNDYQRWAEPVASGFSRVLIQDIALLSGADRVTLFPLTRTFGQEFEVYLLVVQFDGVPGGKVTLRVRWRITGPGGTPNYVVRESVFTRDSTASTESYQGYVEALSALVGDLAQEIVAAIPEAQTAEAAEQAKEAKEEPDKAAAEQAAEAAMEAKAAASKPAESLPLAPTVTPGAMPTDNSGAAKTP